MQKETDKNQNILTDEELADYKRLKEQEEKQKRLQEKYDKKYANYKEKSELLPLVIFGSIIYLVIGLILFVFGFSGNESPTLFISIGVALMVFSVIQFIVVLIKKDDLPKFISVFLYIVNGLPYLILKLIESM